MNTYVLVSKLVIILRVVLAQAVFKPNYFSHVYVIGHSEGLLETNTPLNDIV